MISVQKRKSTCSPAPPTAAATKAMAPTLSRNQPVCQQRAKAGGNVRKRAKTASSSQSLARRGSLNQILDNQQQLHHIQHQQQQKSDEPVWIFGLINNIEQLLTTFGNSTGGPNKSVGSASSASFSATSPSSTSCSSTLSSTSTSSSSSPASYASTGGAGNSQALGPAERLAHSGASSGQSATLPRSPISRQIKFHEYKGPPSVKRQQASNKPLPQAQHQQVQVQPLRQVQQPQAISSNIMSSPTCEQATTTAKPTPSANQRLIDSGLALANAGPMQPHHQLQHKSEAPSKFNQQALTAPRPQPISSSAGVSAIKQSMDVAVPSSEHNLGIFALERSKQPQQSQQQQQLMGMQHNQTNSKQHLARPIIQQIQNQTHTIQQPQQLQQRQRQAQLSSDQLTSPSTQCANSLGHTFYINQTACLDGSNGGSTLLLGPTSAANSVEASAGETHPHQALRGFFPNAQQPQQPVVITTHGYHNQQSKARLGADQMGIEVQASGGQAACSVSPSSVTSEAQNPINVGQQLNMFDELSYSPILSSTGSSSQHYELNTFGPDSEDIDTCEIEPSISFSQVDDLLFSEFIDLQDVPMNVDESDWLKKFLPPCSMS